MYNWAAYECVQCGVNTEDLIASNSYNRYCIVCYYANPENEPCHHQGCAQELQRTLDLQARLGLREQPTAADAEMRTVDNATDVAGNAQVLAIANTALASWTAAASSSSAAPLHVLGLSNNGLNRSSIPPPSMGASLQMQAIAAECENVKTAVREMAQQVQQEVSALKGELQALREQIAAMSERLEQRHASPWNAWQAGWSPATEEHLAGGASWSRGSPSAAATTERGWR
jgi:hypothetical protein